MSIAGILSKGPLRRETGGWYQNIFDPGRRNNNGTLNYSQPRGGRQIYFAIGYKYLVQRF